VAFARAAHGVETVHVVLLDASPGHCVGSSGGEKEGLWRAMRGSRRTSAAFREPSIMPSQTSPSAKFASMPLIRGAPSLRNEAMVLCLPASNSACAR
jgi:hypothetical protein